MLLKPVLLKIIDIYQQMTKNGIRRCVYTPSCSNYAKVALEEHSLLSAIVLIIRRLVRCRPGVQQHYDPVPNRRYQS